MVLKSDDNSGELCRATDASEDSSSTLLASERRRGQKGQGLDKGGSSINRRANDVNEVFCSGVDKNDKNRSCVSGLRKNLEQEAEVVDSRTSPGSLGSGNDMEDEHHESMKHSQFSEATTQKLSVLSSYKCRDQTEKVMGSNILSKSDEMGERSLQTSPGDDVDEPDVEEEDVKVCDICGDAGHEDLLAVCSRCADGAEHTYCMREMLDKVPEGDWLCEECKYNEALKARRQEHLKLLGTERSKSFGRTSSVSSDVSSKLDSKDSFNERSKLKTVSLSKQLSLKRSGDNIEASPTAKKRVIELSTGSPTALSPSQVPVLSKDFSFKDSDKTKGKPTNQFSAGTDSGGDSSENALSPTRNSKGNLVKSNSFSSSKANKGSNEVVQKQKLMVDVKDGPGKFIGKSLSFKGLGRSIVGEPKVKPFSPKCAPVQELKGQKQIRDCNSFERKNSIKLDNSFSVQTAANSTKHLSRDDNVSTSSVSNSCDYKSDGKLTSLSKQTSNASHKSPDALASLGEVKRLSSTNIKGSGTSSLAEAKPSHVSSKERPTFNSSRAFDGSYGGANGTKADLHDSESETSLETAFIRSRQGANGALVGGNRRGFSLDASTLRPKDGVHEENKLKAAIEAAMQKKQNIVKKNKVPEKLNELSVSNSQGNYVDDAVSDQVKDFTSEEAVHARDSGLSNHTSNSCKHISIGSAKQFKAVDFVSSEEDKSTMSAIPLQEAVWQGGFEIHRNGKRPDICGGFQAHLSSSASNKVLKVVRKLPQKIVFNEVSRSCVWPFQFKEASAREDNIALYFFAKDLESYLRSYKILLEYMMKHDLAFRGNFNGVELLIFPSNHLAHGSERWNTLFFMWGVFRGRKAHCPDEICRPQERPEIAVSVSNTVPRINDNSSAACLSKNTSLQRPAVEDSSLSGSDNAVSKCKTPVLDRSSLQKSGPLVNGDCYNKGCSVGETCLTSPTSQVNLEKRSEKHSSVVLISEARSESGTSAVEDRSQIDLKVVQLQCSSQDGDSDNNLQHESKKPVSNDLLAKLDISSHSSKSTKLHMVVTQEDFSSDNLENKYADGKSDKRFEQEDQREDNMKKNGVQVILDNNEDPILENKNSVWKNDKIEAKEENRLKQGRFVDINVSAECSMEDLHSVQCLPKRHSDDDSVKLASEATSVIISHKRLWMDQNNLSGGDYEASISKSIKRTDELYGREIQRISSSFGDGLDTHIHVASTSSRVNDRSNNEALDEKLKSLNPGSAERCFFLGGSLASQSVQSEDDCSPCWKVSLLGNENRLPVGSPDLELALGVEKKQSRKGVLPFFSGIVDRTDSDRPPDIASPKAEDEDASASLSLSLAFPFSV